MTNNPYFERDRAAALNALEQAQKLGTVEALEQAITVAAQFARNWYRQPEPAPLSERDLAQKREARLYREAYESLSEGERAEFEKQYGFSATIRRLAEEARRQADEAWEQRQLQWQDEQYRQGRAVQHLSGAPVGTDWDKIYDLQEQTEQRRRERAEARAKRELAAEVHDEELARLLATFDREELEIFNHLMENQPTQLDALRAYKASKGHNPLENVNDPAELYGMAFSSRGVNPETLPADISGVEDSNTLYDIALKKALEE